MLILFLFFIILNTKLINQVNINGNIGKRYQENWLNIISLQGDFYTMGQQYGKLMPFEIKLAYEAMVVKTFIDSGVLSYDVLKMELYDNGWNSLTRRQQRLFEGMSNTSSLPVEKLFILDQIMYAFVLAKIKGGLKVEPSCSFISINNNGIFLGRNLDWFASYIDYSPFLTLVVYNPTDGSNSVANIVYAGIVNVLTGFNSTGLFLELNSGLEVMGDTLYKDRSRYMNQLLEILFDSNSFETMHRRIIMSRPEFANIINIANKEQSLSFENAPQQVLKRNDDGHGVLVATNVYLSEQWNIEIFETPSYSLKRYYNLLELGFKNKKDMCTEKLKYILEQPLQINGTIKNGATIYEYPNNVPILTVYSIVADMSNEFFWIRVPNKTPWVQINYTKYFH